jgi:flagellar protein FliO/FliZ
LSPLSVFIGVHRRLLCFSLCMFSLAAHAAEAQEPAGLGATLQSLLALGVVLGAIVGAAWLLRRLQGGAAISSPLLKTIAATAVGPRERVVIVEVQDTWLVLGVSQGAVRTLHTLPRGTVPETAATGFAAWLDKAKAVRRDQ